MKVVCSKNIEHDEFLTVAHVMQDQKVDSEGNFLEVYDDCVEVTHTPDIDNYWQCAICGAMAITRGKIVTLYATVLEGQEDSYTDIYDNEDEAREQIGKYVDDLKVIDIKVGYSIAPKGMDILYNEAPDFCESREEAIDIANELNIVL